MKKCVFTAIAVIAVLSIALCLDAQPAGGAGAGGGRGGFGGAGAGGGMMGGGMMGGGTRGIRAPRPRPDKKARLASIKDLEKQVAALKTAIEKGPDKDPNLVTIKEADLTKFMDSFTVESNAINAIQATLTSLGTTGGRMRTTGITEEVLSELSGLAKDDKATKTAARIDELIKEAQDRTNRRGAGGAGMMGGAGGGRGGRGGRGGV